VILYLIESEPTEDDSIPFLPSYWLKFEVVVGKKFEDCSFFSWISLGFKDQPPLKPTVFFSALQNLKINKLSIECPYRLGIECPQASRGV